MFAFSTGKIEDANDNTGGGLLVTVTILSVVLMMTLICVVILVTWIIKLTKKIAKVKKQ